MKQVNFSHPGGFPLEQETLERLQTAYRSELYEAIKRHLSILPDTNYLIAHAQSGKQGWTVVHQDGEGILYPITFPTTGGVTNYLKTIRTTTNLIYGDGNSQKAYTDYQAEYVSAKGTPTTNDTETVNYYDLGTFKTVKSIQAIEEIIAGIDGRIKTIESTVPAIDNRVKTIETTLPTIDTKINTIKNDLESYLPLDGSKAMRGDLNLGTHQLYLNNLSTSTSNNLLALNDQNQVVKSSTLLNSLLSRITKLEEQTDLIPSIQLSISNLKESLTAIDGRVQTTEQKLNTIESGAQKNVQSDWDVSNVLSDAYIKNKVSVKNPFLMKNVFNIGNVGFNGNVNDEKRTVSFPSVGTSKYMVLGSLRGRSEVWNQDNDVFWSYGNEQETSFDLFLREITSDTQDLKFYYVLVPLD